MDFVIAIFVVAILVFSAVIHEFAHGWMADSLGDPTARHMGRLTLNPIPHIDLMGSVLIPLFLIISGVGIIFAWAKPVPYNPYNLRDKKNGEMLVALAGPISNLIIAVIFGIIVRVMIMQEINSSIIMLFGLIIFINILLAIFNLLPIPPLDGSKILFHFLPYSMRRVREILERNGMLMLLIFIFFLGGFRLIIWPILVFLFVVFTDSTELLFNMMNMLN
ncbi:MAG: site-2 protease family protein [Candidatus Pacebacteria bacterium]|nr:site-2 protease family protein [Candidatus Paceibacterota bacterium]